MASKESDEQLKESKIDTKYYDELFKRTKDSESNEFNDPEALDILYANIIDEIKESDLELKKCASSFHVDYFVYKSKPDHFCQLFDLLTKSSERLDEFLADTRLSRIYEACLVCAGDKVANASADQLNQLKASFVQLATYLNGKFLDILETQNCIFALRAFLRVIGHHDAMEEAQQQQQENRKSQKTNKFDRDNQTKEFNIKDVCPKLMPDDWQLDKFLKKMSKHLVDINILEIGLVPSASPCISLLLRKLSMSYKKKSAKILNAIHDQLAKKSNSFHTMIQDAIGSRFIESFLLSCPTQLLVEHYLNEHIIPNIVDYSKHIYANYPIQALLKYRLEKDPEISVLYDAILENLNSIVNLHSDLIYKNYLIIDLIEACYKTSTLDPKKLTETIMEFFGCNSDENRVHFLRVLLVYEKVDDILKETPIDQALFILELKPIACTIACKLIENDDKYLAKSLSSLNSNELEFLCTNKVGSHFVQQCLREFSKRDRSLILQSIFDRLKGRLLILSTNSSGSYVMETLWTVATLKQRIAIADELKPNDVQLSNDRYARFLVKRIGLNYYKRKPDDWKEMQASELKKRKMFADLFESNQSDQNAKRIKS